MDIIILYKYQVTGLSGLPSVQHPLWKRPDPSLLFQLEPAYILRGLVTMIPTGIPLGDAEKFKKPVLGAD